MAATAEALALRDLGLIAPLAPHDARYSVGENLWRFVVTEDEGHELLRAWPSLARMWAHLCDSEAPDGSPAGPGPWETFDLDDALVTL